MSEKHESEHNNDREPDDDLSEDSTRWTCRECSVWVALGDGLEVPRHGLCHPCASGRVDDLEDAHQETLRQLAEVTAERDALKRRVAELEAEVRSLRTYDQFSDL